MKRHRKLVVRGCNLLLGVVFVLWLLMVGTDYMQTMKRFHEPLFASIDHVKSSDDTMVYQGVGYHIEMTVQKENQMKLSAISFYLFQKWVGGVVID